MCSGKSISCSAGSFLCFLQIIVVLLQQTHAVTNNKQAYCAPSSCGKITNISHPFRLKDDPATCGDPRYELACENNRTVLSLYSGKYYVEVINYKNFTIRLVDPAIQEADNCSSILTPRYFLYTSNFSDSYTHNDTADPYQTTQWRITDGPTIQDLVKLQMFQHLIYMNCSNPVTDDPVYADTAPCSINRDSKGHVYAIAGDLRVGNLKDDCHVEVVAAISFSGFNYSYGGYNWDMPDQNFSNTQIHRMLVYGFEVSWMGQPCEELCGRKRCYLSEPTWSLACEDWADHCVTPLGFHVRCGTPSELRIFVEVCRTGDLGRLHMGR